jgi:diguanylate cyclase (GGDEF)-like protein
MTVHRLKALFLSEDRSTLRQIAKFLDAFGFQSSQAVDRALAIAALRRDHHDFVIFDADPSTPALRDWFRQIASACGQREPVYTFLMIASPTADAINDALTIGIDDFLAKPVNFGELLARLRAGARILEQRRRLLRQEGTDPATGLATRLAFRQTLQQLLDVDAPTIATVSCAALDLDFFGQFQSQYGRPFADRALGAIAKALSDRAGTPKSIGAGAGDQFFVALPGMSESEGASWADQLRCDVAQLPLEVDGTRVHVTASIGVAASHQDRVDAEELLQRACEAQRLAKQSGRNCVATYSQLHTEASSWASHATPGKLFERTVARDVMIPCPVILRRDETIGRAQTLFQRTQLPVIPVVDAVGNLAGCVAKNDVTRHGCHDGRVRDVLIADVPSLDEDTAFSNIMDFYTTDERSLIFVVRRGRPAGLVTRDSLAMLSEPLDDMTFAPNVSESSTSDYLRVIDSLCTDSL